MLEDGRVWAPRVFPRDAGAALPEGRRWRFLAVSEKLRQVLQLASAATGAGHTEWHYCDDDTRHSKSAMMSKREERKQRAELDRIERERQKRARGVRNRVMLVVGVLAVAAVVVLTVTRRQASGRVWSAEHGHWHDK